MSIFTADRYVSKVSGVSVDALAEAGVKCVLIDRDNTCVPRDTKVAPPEVLDWFAKLRARGISCCMVSNNFHSTQVAQSAAELGCDVVDHAMKPAPFAVWAALRKEGVSKRQAVLIGDQVFTDIVAGNLAGVKTILVRPQSRRDLWYTYIFRVFELLALHGKTFEGEEPKGRGR